MTHDLLDKWDRQLYELTKTRAVSGDSTIIHRLAKRAA